MGIAIVPISIIDVDTKINPIVSFYVSSNVIWNIDMPDYLHNNPPLPLFQSF